MRTFLLGDGSHDAPTSLGLAAIRITAAVLLVVNHGWGNLRDFGGGVSDPFEIGLTASAVLLVAVQMVGPVLVTLGLFTRPAALLAAAGLAVLEFHAPWWDAGWIVGRLSGVPDAGVLYVACFGALVFTGAGSLSLDRAVGR